MFHRLGICSNINCGGASTEAEKRAEKGGGRSKGGKEVIKENAKKRRKDYKEGGINQTAVPELNTPWRGRVSRTILHHLNVVLLVLPKMWWNKLDYIYKLLVCLEVCVHVCVWWGGGGGGGITHLFF